ncbi:MAG: apolipoprotein N-acyltransferase [Alphaproteobacteria bacterium RIFCSPHIGHO2_12_FULL_45_9]|nr:MAG: apolipoprotein N-acyltransferase [Alphaproteobacteria bacterium RIFCSPHIGHO2_02_FULL_46_13]OFW95885.1 MAG: apolipoprotein N-acyltransferase [Alphaproteobacteria bacterium RIFCSPHIGHO2_12_FULL_45_9]
MWKENLKNQLRVNPFFASLVLGHLAAYGMGPYYAWPVLLICLSLYWVNLTSLADDKTWKSFLSGFLFGFGYFVSSLWWIGNALLVGGNEFKWAYPFAAGGLPLLLAIFPMIATGLIRLFAKGRSFTSFIVFIAAMFLAEFARGTMFTGFPWNLFGMSWTDNLAMLQILSVGGVYLLSALTIFMFTAPAFAFKGKAHRALRGVVLTLAIGCGAGLYMFGNMRLAEHPTTYNKDVVVQMIQPNIPQEDKWNSGKRWDNFRNTLSLIEPIDNWQDAKTRVVVMPETTLTYHDLQTEQAMESLHGRISGYSEKNIYVLSGALLRDDAGYHNSLIVLDKDLNFLESFDKFHLVPFGEYIPFQNYIPIPTVTQFSGFVEGTGPRTLTHPNLPPFSPLVCYEVIFPGKVAGTPRPDWLVNVTNDAWYGVSPGPFQHLAHAQYRAIEEGLPMVRVAQTGVSAVFDAYGRVTAVSGLNGQANVETLLPTPAPATIYSQMH